MSTKKNCRKTYDSNAFLWALAWQPITLLSLFVWVFLVFHNFKMMHQQRFFYFFFPPITQFGEEKKKKKNSINFFFVWSSFVSISINLFGMKLFGSDKPFYGHFWQMTTISVLFHLEETLQ